MMSPALGQIQFDHEYYLLTQGITPTGRATVYALQLNRPG